MNLRLFCRCFSTFLHSWLYKTSEGKNTVYKSRIRFVLCKLKLDLDHYNHHKFFLFQLEQEGMEGFWEDGVWSWWWTRLISGLSWHTRWQLSLTAGHTGQTSWRHFQTVFAFQWHEIQIVSVYKLTLCEIFFFFEHNLIHLTHLCTVKMYLIEPFLQSAESILEEDSSQRCRVYFMSVCILEEKKKQKKQPKRQQTNLSVWTRPFFVWLSLQLPEENKQSGRAGSTCHGLAQRRWKRGCYRFIRATPSLLFFSGAALQVPGRGIACAAQRARIWLTNICSFMVIFCTQLCKRHFPLWQIAPQLGFANFQTLFCLLGFEERQGGKE